MNSDNILVSIIVPAYNVDKYIEKCIRSLIEQTHSAIQIIIVNDGSNDRTGDICDNFAKEDSRVSVFHTENKGVSCARNVGIRKATGEYIIFVDADDYLEACSVDYLLRNIINSNADFCFSKKCYMKDNDKGNILDDAVGIDNAHAIRTLLSQEVIVGCWNKIYKSSFIKENEIYFSEDLFFGEGLEFIIKVSKLADNIAMCNGKTYYYRKDNVNSATTSFDINKFHNGELAISKIEREVQKIQEVQKMLQLHRFFFCSMMLNGIFLTGNRKKYKRDYIACKRYIRETATKVLMYSELSNYTRIKIFICWINPFFIAVLATLKRKYYMRRSV